MKLGVENFKASRGFLDRFKKRYKIRSRKFAGEAADCPDTQEWLTMRLPELLMGYRAKDIYNADETALFFKLTPDRTFAFDHEHLPGRKQIRDRLSLMFMCNMDGSHRYKVMVIGKVKKPRRLKNIHHITPEMLPVIYRANEKAWMTREIFEPFVRVFNEEMKRQKRRVLLFVDNAASHILASTFSNVRIEFLPANSTSKLQPLDQGIIRSVKCRYKADLAKKYLFCINSGRSRATFKDDIDLKVACDMIDRAWRETTNSCIQRSFKQAGFEVDNFEADDFGPEEDNLFMDRNVWDEITRLCNANAVTHPFSRYADFEKEIDNARTEAEMTYDEVVESIRAHDSGESDPEDVPDDVRPAVGTTSDAMQHISDLRTYAQRNKVSYEYLDRFEAECTKIHINHIKQTTIDRYAVARKEKLARMKSIMERNKEVLAISQAAEAREKAEREAREREEQEAAAAAEALMGQFDDTDQTVDSDQTVDESTGSRVTTEIQTELQGNEHTKFLDHLEKNASQLFTADLGLTEEDLASLPPGFEVNVEVPVPAPLAQVDLPGSEVSQDSEGWSYSVTDTGVIPQVDSESVKELPETEEQPETLGSPSQSQEMEIELFDSDDEEGVARAKMIVGPFESTSSTVNDSMGSQSVSLLNPPSPISDVIEINSSRESRGGGVSSPNDSVEVEVVSSSESRVGESPPRKQRRVEKAKDQPDLTSSEKTKLGMRKLSEIFKTKPRPSGLSKRSLSRKKNNK